ncbi:hypothetical protein EU557_01480 [Hymenobacter wooponensis]|uniref:Uncharacterized protein n=2 Tax=Hymenobacter wooponensis TaxID=1525360 RepID=A0A4Z0MTN3_9BACT|nr:hypothetical protein EU557_01480 [Hymenobacter wooponensis]
MVSRMGWHRLAKQYAVETVPATVERTLLAHVRIGLANYKNSVRAGATSQGLWLTTWKIFFLGHPPLFVPWAAFGPIRAQKFLWVTSYSTDIDCGGYSVRFMFSSDWLRQTIPASVPVQE